MLNRSSGIRAVFQHTQFGLLMLLVLLPFLYSSALSAASAEAAAPAPAPACKRGEELERLGRRDEAEQAYLKDLKTQQGVKCAPAKLEHLGRREALCERAEELAAAGDEAAAKAAYEKALEAEPRSRCASRHLAKVEKPSHWWEWAATAAKDTGGVLALLVLAAATLVVVVLLILQVLTRLPWVRDRWPARLALRPSLEVQPMGDTSLTTKMGPQLASLVRGKITPRRTGSIIVTGHAAIADVLKPLSDVSSEAKAGVAIISFLFSTLPKRNFQVTGALQPAGELGWGISVELTNENRELGSTTFWANEFDVPKKEVRAFQQLAVPTAAWIDHRIAAALGVRDSLLSSDPMSWALFRAGAGRHEAGEGVRAQGLYRAALARDPDNIGAMANLGLIEAGEMRFGQAHTLMTGALGDLELRSNSIPTRLNPDWYRIKYNLAVLYANWASEDENSGGGEKADELRQAAHKEAEEVAEAALSQLRRRRDRRRHRDLVNLLRKPILQEALIVYGGTVLADGDGAAGDRIPQDEDELGDRLANGELPFRAALGYVTANRPNADTFFTLACAYTQVSAFTEAKDCLKESLEKTPEREKGSRAEGMLTDTSLRPLLDDPGNSELKAELEEISGK